MRRTIILAVLAIALTFPAAASADTAPGPSGPGNQVHYLNRGTGGAALYTNLAWSDEGPLPGTYFFTGVDFSSYVSTDGGSTYEFSFACIYHETFTIDADGNWTSLEWISACGEASITTGRNLSSGRVVASFPIVDCVLYDEVTWDCLEWVDRGTVDVDVTLTGTGRTYRWHNTGSGGTAGMYQYAYHGIGAGRSAIPSGSITFDGASLTDGATFVDGQLWNSRDGWVEVIIGN